MKITLLLAIAMATLSFNSYSQCTRAIPSNAVVANHDTVIDGGFAPIWVCSGDTLISDGGFHDIFLESGAVLNSGGGVDRIWVKAGAQFYMSGGVDTVFYVNFSDLHLNGGFAYPSQCGAVVFDYTNAPVIGCFVPPIANFQASDTAFCPGTCIDFTNLSTNAISYQWSFPGSNTLTSTDENPTNICYDSPGIYNVTLVAINGSGSDTATGTITVYPGAGLPVITQNGDTLAVPLGYATYKWYMNTIFLVGDTNYYYVITQNGDYTVNVTDSNGCSGTYTLNDVDTTVNGISEINNSRISVSPNPATNSIVIVDSQIENIQFFDLLGRNLYSVQTSADGKTVVDISSFPSIFFIRTEEGVVKKVLRY